MAFYVDTSAFLKLQLREEHDAAMRRWWRANGSQVVSSDLLRTEALRTVRVAAPRSLRRTRQLLDSVDLIALDIDVCERAALLDPSILRTLDALHLAAAMTFEDELEAIVTYDRRLAEAADLHGIAVLAPS